MGFRRYDYYTYLHQHSSAASDAMWEPWNWLRPSYWKEKREAKELEKRELERIKQQIPVWRTFYAQCARDEFYGTPFSVLGR